MSNKAIYHNICAQHPELSVFSRGWWLDAVCAGNWQATIAVKGDLVRGIWAYPTEKKAGVTLLRTPMLTPYLGPVIFFPADIKESNKDAWEHETITELLKQMPAAPVWHMALAPGLKQAGIFHQAGLTLRVQQTFLIDLAPDEATLLGNMKDTLRRNLKQAEKEITISQSPAHLEQLCAFHRHTLNSKQKQTHHTHSDLHRIFHACAENNAGALWIAKEGETVMAAVWQVWDGTRSYYLMGGQNHEVNSYKAMSLLLWHCMKEAKKRGCAFFDLEGSMDEGVERFFRSFGGRRELYMVVQKNDSFIWKVKQLLRG